MRYLDEVGYEVAPTDAIVCDSLGGGASKVGAVVAVRAPHDDLAIGAAGALGVEPGDLQSRVHGFGPRAAEEDAAVGQWRSFDNHLGGSGGRRVGERIEGVVGRELVHLGGDGLHHVRATVAYLAVPQAGQAIDVAFALVVVECRSFAPHEIDVVTFIVGGGGERVQKRVGHAARLSPGRCRCRVAEWLCLKLRWICPAGRVGGSPPTSSASARWTMCSIAPSGIPTFDSYREPLTSWRKASGFGHHDYAIRNAAWHVVDQFAEMHAGRDRRDGFLDPLSQLRDGPDERYDLGSPEESASVVKRVAKVFGANLAGVTANDPRWVYTEAYSREREGSKPNNEVDGLPNVLVVGQAMDRDLVQTVPSALSGVATGLGYSIDAVVVLATAQFIRNLGYRAVPTMNDTALAIPLAIAAGLGEYGRHGLVITKEFGPRVRGKPSIELHNRSNITGVEKWSVDGEKCFSYWAAITSDCAICIRVCPYNKDFSKKRHRVGRWLAGTPLRRVMGWLHDRRGYGKRLRPRDWWAGDSPR